MVISNEEVSLSTSDRRDEEGEERKMKQMQGKRYRPIPNNSYMLIFHTLSPEEVGDIFIGLDCKGKEVIGMGCLI